MSNKIGVFPILTILLASMILIISQSTTAFGQSSPTGLIAFESDRDGNREIYVMNADGTSQTRLTNNPASDINPSWSHDGTKIAFESTRDGNDQIYVMNADGTSQTNISDNLANDVSPSWSPDGTKIVFVSTRDGNNEIYVMNSDGSSQTRITTNTASYPSRSPDGTKIVFVSTGNGNNEIYVMNADGTGQTNISNNPAYEVDPVWQPIPTKPVPVHETETAIRICHIPPGDPNNPQTISISKYSLSTHMAHGDTIGGCHKKPIPVPEKNGVWGKITLLNKQRYPYYDLLHIDAESNVIRDKLCEKTFGEDGKLYYDSCFSTDLYGISTKFDAAVLNKISYQKLRVELYTDNYAHLLDTKYFIWNGFSGEPSPQPEATPQPESDLGLSGIIVTTDKEYYADGDTVVISGQVRDLLSGKPVSLQVFAANGNLVTIEEIDVSPAKTFSTEISAGGGLWESKGTYTVKVLYGTQSRTAETTFEFGGSEGFSSTPSPQPIHDTLFNSCSELAKSSLIGDKQIVVTTDKESYNNGDTVMIFGKVRELLSGTPVSLQVIAANGQVISIEQIDINPDKTFCKEISAGGSLWKSKGTYSILALYGKDWRTARTTFEFGNYNFKNTNDVPKLQPEPESLDKKITICHIPSGNPSNAHTISISQSAWSAHQAHDDTRGECQQGSISEVIGDHSSAYVSIVPGSSVPGCEVTKECFTPYQVSIDEGGKVTWSNDDTAAHTVTSGNPADGADGSFDSSLFMTGNTFSVQFDDYEKGTYPYFCMVHPWMTGEVIVGDGDMESIPNWNGNTNEQNKPKTISSLTKQNQQSLWSDKSTYVDGSIIHIEGKTKDIQPNSIVNVRVYSPSNYNIVDEKLTTSNDGKFEVDFDTSDKLWFENGQYIIKVEDQRHSEQNQIKVSVIEANSQTESPQEIPVLLVDKTQDDVKP